MKTLVLFQHAIDNRPVVIADSIETAYRTKYYLMDKYRQTYDILYVHDKVLDETSYYVNIYGNQYHGESLEALSAELKDYHGIDIVAPFDYE